MALDRGQGQPEDNKSRDYAGFSVPNRIGYRFSDLDPGANVYVQRDDSLIIQTCANSGADTINVAVRILTPGREAGPTQPDQATQANPLGNSPFGVVMVINRAFAVQGFGTVNSNTITLPEGYLLSIAVTTAAAKSWGEMFCRAFIQRSPGTGGFPALVLFQDYITQSGPAGWPAARLNPPVDGPGAITATAVGNPAAGADWTFTPSATSRNRIISVQATFATSAVAANRNIQFRLVEVGSGAVLGTWPVNATVAASASVTVVATAGLGFFSTLVGGVRTAALPDGLIIVNNALENTRIETVTQAIDPGDQWSAIRIAIEAWLDF